MYLVPSDIVESWRSQFREEAADHPGANYARRTDADLRRAVTTDNPSVSVRERATEAADKLGRYLNARKLRNAPPPPAVPPPPEEALLLPPQAAAAAAPAPQAAAAPPPPPPPPPLPLAVPRRQAPGRRFAAAADDDDDEVQLFDQDVLHGVLPSLRARARQVLDRIRAARVRGITFGPSLGQVYANGRPIADMAELLNDAVGTRLRARRTDSPGYDTFTHLLERARVPPHLLSAPYQAQQFPLLRSVGDDGAVGEELRAWRPVRRTPASSRRIKRTSTRRPAIMPRWEEPPNY